MNAPPVLATTPGRDALWEHCRNSLGIARLLVTEGRPEPMVITACQLALESACRAALEHAGLQFDGDVRRGLQRLGALVDIRDLEGGGPLLAATERAIARVASYLRHAAPERSWGF
jgi:hypothetical protein